MTNRNPSKEEIFFTHVPIRKEGKLICNIVAVIICNVIKYIITVLFLSKLTKQKLSYINIGCYLKYILEYIEDTTYSTFNTSKFGF